MGIDVLQTAPQAQLQELLDELAAHRGDLLEQRSQSYGRVLPDARKLERVLVICEKQLGPDHPDTAVSLNDLAGLLQVQGAFAEARPLLERALAITEKQLGPEHPETARSLHGLAVLLEAQGALAEARPLFERALAIHEARLGPDHPHTRLVRGNLYSLPES